MGYACCHTCFHIITYILLQVATSTPIYTMEVNSSSGKIEKFRRRLGTIFFEGVQGNFLSYGL